MSTNANFAQKLRLARLGAGLSQQALADAVSISKQMISKYEKGLAQPNSVHLSSLAKAVDRKPGFLLSAPSFDLESVKFRQSDNLSKKQVAKVQAVVAMKLEARMDLEQVLSIDRTVQLAIESLKQSLEPIFKAFGADSVAVGEKMAEVVRSQWGLGYDPIPHLSGMLERRGVHVLPIKAPVGFEGMSAQINAQHGVIVVRDTLPEDPFRYRFTIAHELCHLLDVLPASLDEAQQEKICNCFAGAFLFPKDSVHIEYGDYRSDIFLQEMIDVKIRYGISLAAQSYRLCETGVIKDKLRIKIRKWLNATEDRKYERNLGSFASELRGDYNDQLLMRALAEEAITMSKAAEIKGVGLREIRAMVGQANGW